MALDPPLFKATRFVEMTLPSSPPTPGADTPLRPGQGNVTQESQSWGLVGTLGKVAFVSIVCCWVLLVVSSVIMWRRPTC